MPRILIILSLAALLAATSLAAAGLPGAIAVTLDSPVLAGLPGATLTFSGSLANSSGADQYINGAEVILNGFNSSSFDSTNFLPNAPLILTKGTTTSSFNFLTVTIPAQFASGPYIGQLGVFGGSTATAQNLLGIVTFTVQVGGTETGGPGACDVTGDSVTNVADVQAILNQALGASPSVAGDLNGDGAIDVVDVEIVINAALNLGCVTVNTATSSVTATKAVDGKGNVYTIDAGENRIRKLAPDGTISTVATVGVEHPTGVSVDSAGNLYVTDGVDHRVLKLSAGTITNVRERP
jgi:hypothetical protein